MIIKINETIINMSNVTQISIDTCVVKRYYLLRFWFTGGEYATVLQCQEIEKLKAIQTQIMDGYIDKVEVLEIDKL